MNKFIFYFLAGLSTSTLAFTIKTIDIELKERHDLLAASFEENIQKKLTSLIQEIDSFKQKSSWKNISKQLEALHACPEYKSIQRTQETLNLLDSLENHSLALAQPTLLQAISSFLESETSADTLYRSFFQKERAWLMDSADEAILLKKKQATIFEFKEILLEKLNREVKKIKSLELYNTLLATHKNYLNDKKTKKISSLIDKIANLEREKKATISADKQYLSLKNKEELLLAKNTLFCLPQTSLPIINPLTRIKLDLFLAPLEILIL